MKNFILLLALTLSIAGLVLECASVEPLASRCTSKGDRSFCSNLTKDPNAFCPDLPNDVDVVTFVGYDQLQPDCQRPFDYFSWQQFVALNWPADAYGNPVGDSLTQYRSAPRVWEFFTDPTDLFDSSFAAKRRLMVNMPGIRIMTMSAKNTLPRDSVRSFLQATQQPLIDRNLNFVLFEIRVNRVWAQYVSHYKLTTYSGQQAFYKSGKRLFFPAGRYSDTKVDTGGTPGAIEIKAAWRILDPAKGDRPERYYTRRVSVYIDSNHTFDRRPLVLHDVLVGLVGFHINHYTSNEGGLGIWSTFEHEDNAPYLKAPPVSDTTHYSFYNVQCTSCPVNVPPPDTVGGMTGYFWLRTSPYAKPYAWKGMYGIQVIKTDSIYYVTRQVNQIWREKLRGTVWQHYRLVGSQWASIEGTGSDTVVGIPVTESNTALETYVQTGTFGSCMTCHGFATASYDSLKSNMSFLLQLARGH
jgi:hypothetical protein